MDITKEKLQELVDKVTENKPQESDELIKFHFSLINKGLKEYEKGWHGDALDYFINLNAYFVNYASLISTVKEIDFLEQLENKDLPKEVKELIDAKLHDCYQRVNTHQDNIKLLESELGIQ